MPRKPDEGYISGWNNVDIHYHNTGKIPLWKKGRKEKSTIALHWVYKCLFHRNFRAVFRRTDDKNFINVTRNLKILVVNQDGEVFYDKIVRIKRIYRPEIAVRFKQNNMHFLGTHDKKLYIKDKGWTQITDVFPGDKVLVVFSKRHVTNREVVSVEFTKDKVEQFQIITEHNGFPVCNRIVA